MAYAAKHVTIDDVNEWNKLIDKYTDNMIIMRAPDKNTLGSNLRAVVWERETSISLKVKDDYGVSTCYEFWINGEPKYETDCLRQMMGVFTRRLREADIKELTEVQNDKAGSVSSIIWYNEEKNGTRNTAWEYDLNSAYVASAIDVWPDCSKVIGQNRIVEKGQMGFAKMPKPNKADGLHLEMIEEGGYADLVFGTMECPAKIKEWFLEKYKEKQFYKKVGNKKELAKAKGVMVSVIGNLQNYNAYVRSAIVSRVNHKMAKLIDEDTLAVSTDAIVSMRPLDLDIGDGLGQFKLEHDGELYAYKGTSHQWNYDTPSVRRVSKARFEKDYDLLSDEMPVGKFPYKFDEFTGKISEVD